MNWREKMLKTYLRKLEPEQVREKAWAESALRAARVGKVETEDPESAEEVRAREFVLVTM